MARHALARHERSTLSLGLLAFCAGVIVLLLALLLGFTIEASSRDMADSAKGQLIAIPAAVALVAGVVSLIGRRRGWGFVLSCVGAAAGVLALLLYAVLPGGAD